jgi:uncharacterized protein (DUF433 family)
MTIITVTIPDFLHAEVDQLVKREGMSWDQFVALAVAEKTSAIATEGYLEERARRGSKEKFLAAMAKVADVEPPDERDRWISAEAHHLTVVLAEPKVAYETQVGLSKVGSDDEEMMTLTRVTFDPKVMGGKPCIRGMRVTVGMIVGLVAAGYSTAEILAAYPYLEAADVREALNYAAWRVEERDYPLVAA